MSSFPKKGIAFALTACFIWGSIFVIPQWLMSDYTAIEIALGRYLVYGLASCMIFLHAYSEGHCIHGPAIWKKALIFALISSSGYYTFVVLALRYSSPAICALILGTAPITIAFYGNWKQKEIRFRSLIGPSILILAGLLIINIPHIQNSETPSLYFLGLLCSLLALLSWTWFVVANARFLRKHPKVHPSDWSTMIGAATLFWAVFFGSILIFFDGIHLSDYAYQDPAFQRFLLGCTILGLICSWFGAYLWNRTSLYLPVSLAGQLTIFETIFGLIFVYTYERTFPSFTDFLGIIVLLFAVIYGIRQFLRSKTYTEQLSPH